MRLRSITTKAVSVRWLSSATVCNDTDALVPPTLKSLSTAIFVPKPGEIGGCRSHRMIGGKVTSAETKRKKFQRPLCKHRKRVGRCQECAEPQDRCHHGGLKRLCFSCAPVNEKHLRAKRLARSLLCEHGVSIHFCFKCAGRGICIHSKVRKLCPQCVTYGIAGCRHGIRLDYCFLCGGNNLCKHLRIPQNCDLCGFRKRCPHGQTHRARCSHCVMDFTQACPHTSDRSRCMQCRKTPLMCSCGAFRAECTKGCPHPLLCEHNKMQFQCGICRWCNHNVKLSVCKLCTPATRYCQHGFLQRECRKCNLCHHGILTHKCEKCKKAQELRNLEGQKVVDKKHVGDLRCEHHIRQRDCYLCARCIHRTRKVDCPMCQDKFGKHHSRCLHGRKRQDCPECAGCKHRIKKMECAVCAPLMRRYLTRKEAPPKAPKCLHGITPRYCTTCARCKHRIRKRDCTVCSASGVQTVV